MTTSHHTALVTGANKGLGFETARQLARKGFTVWLGARDQTRGEAAAAELARDGDVRFVALDVTDPDSITAAARLIAEETGLDVLVNNAGVAIADGDALPSTLDVDALQRTFDVNVHGALRVTQAFLPLVRRSPAGRIVNVSSTLGSIGTVVSPQNPFGGVPVSAYPMSKTALNALTGWFALELKDTAVKVNSVCPGSNTTDMNSGGAQHPSVGARTVVHAATLPADGPTGSFLDVNGVVAW